MSYSKREYDIVVIGTGASGATVAYKCKRAGWDVAVIDSNPFGGTCAVRGCDPKKVLIGFSELVDSFRRIEGLGIKAADFTIDWKALMKFKRTFTDPVPENREKGYRKAGIDTYHGRAHFMGKDTLEVGGEVLKARYFMIGAGSTPRKLGVPGEEFVIYSHDFLELDELPERIVFIGGGYISFEFAHIAAMAGSRVTIIHRSAKALKRFDQDIVKWVLKAVNDKGIDVHLNTPLDSIEEVKDSLGKHLVVQTKGESNLALQADLVVHGAGRVPDIADMNLEKAGVDYDEKGIKVNEYLQSVSNPNVYSAGDAAATRGFPLTPVATLEGYTAASNILKGNSKIPDYNGIPTVTFTIPPLASVGLTEEQAKKEGLNYRVNMGETSGWYSSRRIAEKHSGYKVILEEKTDRLIGAHLFGPHAEEVINIFAIAIRNNLKASALRYMPYSYPTASSDISYMI